MSCKRLFDSQNNLDTHMRTSSIHNARTFVCPFKGCGRSFISSADVALHCESGTCVSGITRNDVDRLAVRYDRSNTITNPARMIGGPSDYQPQVVDTWATEDSWNGSAWECVLCHKTFRSLMALNAHLKSPAHADKIYRCPSVFRGCNMEFRTLSGLLQHVERSSCGVTKFQPQVKAVMDGVTRGAWMLTN